MTTSPTRAGSPASRSPSPKVSAAGCTRPASGAPGGADSLPFVVRPARGHPRADALLLAPTLTYRAYANEHESWFDPGGGEPRPGFEGQPATEDLFAAQNRLLSLYDRHADGTGVTTVSLLRPQVTVRPGLLMPVAGAPHGLGADLYLVDWLEQRGTAYEVAADEDLHADGVELLARYRVVLTGRTRSTGPSRHSMR